MNIEERITTLSKIQGITRAELERRAELGKNTIQRWNEKSPSVDKVARVASVLGVSVDYLLGKENEPTGMATGELDENLVSLLTNLPADKVALVKAFIAGLSAT